MGKSFIQSFRRPPDPPKGIQGVVFRLRQKFIQSFVALGFCHVEYGFVQGDPERITIGEDCSVVNTLFNTASGNIVVGKNTLFCHNCMVLTGVHRFYEGRLASLSGVAYEVYPETPREGNDIHIGEECYIGSGAIILANVNIGDRVIIGAGSVVTHDIPSGKFAAGVPAKVIGES